MLPMLCMLLAIIYRLAKQIGALLICMLQIQDRTNPSMHTTFFEPRLFPPSTGAVVMSEGIASGIASHPKTLLEIEA